MNFSTIPPWRYDFARDVEVPGQQLSDVLRITALGERGEADEVGEEDRDKPPFGDAGVGPGGCSGRCDGGGYRGGAGPQAAPALSAEPGTGRVRRPARRARDGQAVPTLTAELPTRLVCRTAC